MNTLQWIDKGKIPVMKPLARNTLFYGDNLDILREYATWAAICGAVTAMLFPLFFFHYQLMRLLSEVD